MKRIALLCFLLAGWAGAQPQPSNLIGNVPNRTTISLNGVWRTIVDPYDAGEGYGFFRNAKAKNNRDLVEYNFDASPGLNVPGDWNTQRESLYLYESTLWYEKSFQYTKREHTRTYLYFGAAANRATVFLNGEKLGKHEGGYTPFNFEVTERLHEGENFVVVAVNNQRRKDAVPATSTDWWNYGGLTRDVSLVEVPETFVQDYWVQLAKGSTEEIAGWVRLNGAHNVAPKAEQVTVEIPEAKIKKTVTTDAQGYAEFRLSAKGLTLWSPENPKLYRVIVTGAGDKVEDEIGFRTIETRGTKILLNGKPIYLRGISIHEEAPFRGGRAFSAEDDRTLLGWAKELGCNYVRLAHYPHHEGMTRLADKMGLLVWSEVPVYWDTAWTNPATAENAQEQVRDNIARDHNRASVILWSVANETPIEASRTEFLKTLTGYVRSLDNTRLLTAAMNRTSKANSITRSLDDPLGEYVDVLGLNEYLGWYEGKLEDTDVVSWTSPYNKPVLVSEFGAEAQAGNHGDRDTIWTEEFQANFYEHQIRMLGKVDMIAGMSPWVLMDFHSPRRFLPVVQDFHNRKGVISDRGERKKAFYTLQEFYRKKAAE